MNTVTLLSITDETNTCECCGKTNLKRVAVLQLADGSIVRYGRDCAARKLGKVVGKQIDAKVQQSNDLQSMKTLISKWTGKYTEAQICAGLWNKFGYPVQFKNGQYETSIGVI